MEFKSSFLSNFEGYWRRPSEDYRNAVENSMIVIDTNVLLDLYRFTPHARRELLDVLEKVKERIWIPHQVAEEFFTRRIDAVGDQLKLYESTPKELTSLKNSTLTQIHTFSKRCSLTPDERDKLTHPIEESFTRVIEEIQRRASSFDLSREKVATDDPVLAQLSLILDGKVGKEFTATEKKEMLAEFERRLSEEVPPGFKDAQKSSNPHGDFFLWEQTLREASTRSNSVLLVTRDVKDDWVRRDAGFITGARPELVAEMRERADVDFLLTPLGSFLTISREALGADVSASTVAEAESPQTDTNPMIRIELLRSEYSSIMRDMEVRIREHRQRISNRIDNYATSGMSSDLRARRMREISSEEIKVQELVEAHDSIQAGTEREFGSIVRVTISDPSLAEWIENQAAMRRRRLLSRISKTEHTEQIHLANRAHEAAQDILGDYQDWSISGIGNRGIVLNVKDLATVPTDRVRLLGKELGMPVSVIDQTGDAARY